MKTNAVTVRIEARTGSTLEQVLERKRRKDNKTREQVSNTLPAFESKLKCVPKSNEGSVEKEGEGEVRKEERRNQSEMKSGLGEYCTVNTTPTPTKALRFHPRSLSYYLSLTSVASRAFALLATVRLLRSRLIVTRQFTRSSTIFRHLPMTGVEPGSSSAADALLLLNL